MFRNKIFSQSLYGVLDQGFSSLLLFGVNLYLARLSLFNEIGILALVISSIGIAHVLQQAILERPMLIKKNILARNIVLSRFLIVLLILVTNALYLYISSSSFGLNILFLIPLISLGLTQLSFNLLRIYFYSIEEEFKAFYMSLSSLIIIFFIIFLIHISDVFRLSYIILIISLIKSLIILYFLRNIRTPELTELSIDTSKKQYFFLIIISSSMFIKQKLPILFLSTYAFSIVGIYEIIRNVTEILLMPFRPLSQTLLTYFSTNLETKNRLNIIFAFGGIGFLLTSLFSLLIRYIFEIFNIYDFYTLTINIALSLFIFASITLVPINSIFLSTKRYKYEMVVKLLPVILFSSILYILKIYNVEMIIIGIAVTTWLELLIAIGILIYKKINNKDKENIIFI